MKKFAADIALYLYVGRGFIQDVIEDYVDAFGKGYNKDLVDKIESEVLQHADILESLLQDEWADSSVVEWDGGESVHGSVEYEGVESNLDSEELRGLEKVVEDFILPFVEESIDKADVEDLIWIPVESSNVESFAYDEANRFLFVRFLDKGYGGSLYQYDDVEPAIYWQFIEAPSKGKFVWSHLRDRYDYHRLQ